MWGGGQTDTVGTVTVVMSGKAGGSQLKGDKFKTRATPYIPEMLQLLAMRWNTEPEPTGAGLLRPKIELVQQDGPLFFEELWVPGFAGNNYHYCQDQVSSFVNPPASAVMQLLAENALALALTSEALIPSDEVEGLTPELTRMVPTASRLAEIQRLKSACVATYITRLDVKKKGLDGGARELKDAARLAKDLEGEGFCIVNAADFTTVEKAVLFSETKLAVVELGAGLTNILYVADGCVVVQISNPVRQNATHSRTQPRAGMVG